MSNFFVKAMKKSDMKKQDFDVANKGFRSKTNLLANG